MAAKFELKPAKGGKTMFNLKAGNGQVIFTSETYETKKAAAKGIEAVKKSALNDKRFEKRETKQGEQYFVLKAVNGEPLGRSETYTTTKAIEKALASVKKNAPEARVDDLTE